MYRSSSDDDLPPLDLPPLEDDSDDDLSAPEMETLKCTGYKLRVNTRYFF